MNVPITAPSTPRRWLRRVLRVGALLGALALVLGTGGALWLRYELVGSLALLDGQHGLTGLGAPVTIERDALGVPTIRGRSRLDVARATGFVHAQDRYFQMDLARRRAAGELAALIGPAVVATDRAIRVHRLRALAARTVSSLEASDRLLLEAYAEGANAGLASLRTRPFEYLLLRADPAPWMPEDSLLVVLSMFITLQNSRGEFESNRGLMRDVLPAPLFAFLTAPGGEWDTPLDGHPEPAPPIPSAADVDLRVPRAAWAEPPPAPLSHDADATDPELPAGSNSWVVAGPRTATGAALVANDMHLAFNVPHIWYRAVLAWPRSTGGSADEEIRLTGVTLPGVPSLVVGSNGHVAWGFTNSEGDWSDLVLLTSPSDRADAYQTPDGPKPIEHFAERIAVKGQADEVVDVAWTAWGPMVDKDHEGRPRVLHWVVQEPGALNVALDRMADVRTVDEALALFPTVGIPGQNVVVGDTRGHIAWTIAGRIPRRVGCDGALPQSWADGSCRWEGWFAPDEYPRVVDPPGGFIATANNRLASGDDLRKIGVGAYDVGGRARQIVDALGQVPAVTPADLLRIQLDDKALFLDRWRRLLLDVLDDRTAAASPRRQELRGIVDRGWTGRASTDSAAFYFVRAFRVQVDALVLGALTADCTRLDSRFDPRLGTNFETPVWTLVTARPPHLLDPKYADWHALLVAAIDTVIEDASNDGRPLEAHTWGARNTLAMKHPIARAFEALGRWLDMPADELPGDSHMPRVQSPGQGASERMGVSPGRESEGYLHMPGGQSGHPLSDFYRAGHHAWVVGDATPFVPGPAAHTLTLLPSTP